MGVIKKISNLKNYFTISLPALKGLPFPNRIFRFFYVFDMLNALRVYGISTKEYIELGLWKVPSKEYSRYLTERILLSDKFKGTFYTKEAFDLMNNKKEFNVKYSNFLHREWLYTRECAEDILRSFCKKHSKVIIKPLAEDRGRGIKIIDESQVEWLIDEKNKGTYYLVEQVLSNHPILSELNPTSLQTLRVETVLDKCGYCHIINCCLFVGGDKSIVSNAHGGGTQWHVNLQTGVVDSDGYSVEGWSLKRLKNGKNVRGIQIPYFEKLRDFINDVAMVTPEARYIGWDVAVLQDGLAIIEGNVQPGVCTQRVDGIPKLHIIESYA